MSAETKITPVTPQEDQAHIDAMVAKAAGNAAPEGAPTETPADTPERPDWLPEKFATAEDMAAAYAALEAKQGGKPEQAAEETSEEETQQAAEEAVASAGLDMEALTSKFAEKGDLDASDYEALEAKGINRDMVQSYVAGQQALAERLVKNMHDVVGGEETFNDLLGWATENLSPTEIDAFNGTVDTGTEASIKMALEGLNAKYAAAGNKAPNLLQGKKASAANDVFRSTAELTKAMGDPRYATDPAYRNDVEAKLQRSSIF